MKVLGICATNAPKRKSTSMFLLEKALEAARAQGAETEALRLSDYTILPCTACGICIMFKPCPLLKDEHDDVQKLFLKLEEADGFIFSYPVNAVLPPHTLINFFDRLSPSQKMTSQYQVYVMDQIPWVKGRFFVNKKVGIICCASGMGMEHGASALTPLLMSMRASVVAVAGIAMFEYDRAPHIAATPLQKDIEGADFAIRMAQGVGERVVTGPVVYDETIKYVQSPETIAKLAENRGITEEKLEAWIARSMGGTVSSSSPARDSSAKRENPIWTRQGSEALEREIPSFVRKIARRRIEEYALENQIEKIGPELVRKAKELAGR